MIPSALDRTAGATRTAPRLFPHEGGAVGLSHGAEPESVHRLKRFAVGALSMHDPLNERIPMNDHVRSLSF